MKKERIFSNGELVFLLAFALIFGALYGLWYRHNSIVIQYCMDNIEQCEAAYYSNNK